jgi:hypothetical protein
MGVPNQLLFREMNEQLRRRSTAAETLEIVCECRDRDCGRRIVISSAEYASVRRIATRFVVTPGHAADGGDRVVEREPGYVVVELAGRAAEIATRLDPVRRSDSTAP